MKLNETEIPKLDRTVGESGNAIMILTYTSRQSYDYSTYSSRQCSNYSTYTSRQSYNDSDIRLTSKL